MKKIGLLGGMSWQSTVTYYQKINQEIAKRKGGLHSARIIMESVDFAPIAQLQAEDAWQEMSEQLTEAALNIQKAGADCLLICTNTMHLVAPQIQQHIDIPLLHIADATGKQLQRDSVKKVALLGTAFTMQKPFYKERLTERFDIEVIVPSPSQQDIVHRVIYEELCLGNINPDSKQTYLEIASELTARGAQGIILGCTEIGLLLQQQDSTLPLYDTVALHADAAVEFALG